MSLDVYLISKTPVRRKGTGVYIREGGQTKELTAEEVMEKFPNAIVDEFETEENTVYQDNITHNLNCMAMEAGIYEACWRPEEIGAVTGKDLIPMLEVGLAELRSKPEHYKTFNPDNGWGNYEGLVLWVEKYLEACYQYPDAVIEISR